MNKSVFSLFLALYTGAMLCVPAKANPSEPAQKLLNSQNIVETYNNDPAYYHWYYPLYQDKEIVNPYLTPARILHHPEHKYQDQVVLWEGRVLKHTRVNGHDRLSLGTDQGQIHVSFPQEARNLEYDRTGYKVAVKGYLQFKGDVFQGLKGRSCILLEPPLKFNYQKWLGNRSHSLTSALTWRILFHNPQTKYEQAQATAQTLVEKCRLRSIDPTLMAALLQIESAWDVDAVSCSGAQGLGQLMPKTAAGLGVADPFDPLQNLEGATHMVGSLLRYWEQNSANPYAAVLASYNAGPTLLKERKGVVPPYPETSNYVYFIGYVRESIKKWH